jgi:hypothetical protein
MRGVILSFSGQDGIISSQGKQYAFRLGQWKSDKPPVAGLSVEFTLTGSEVDTVAVVDTTQLLKGKGKVFFAHAKTVAQNTYRDAGKPVTIGYGLFAIFALFADTIRNVPVTLAGLVNGLSWYTLLSNNGVNGGIGFLLVLIAILSITVPVFWRHSAAPLAYTLPLIVTFVGTYNLYSAVSDISTFASAFDARAGSAVRDRAFDQITLWFWLIFFLAIYLAVVGYLRYRENRRVADTLQ